MNLLLKSFFSIRIGINFAVTLAVENMLSISSCFVIYFLWHFVLATFRNFTALP